MRDLIIAAINDELGYERSRIAPAIADAILSLPEMVDMKEKAEKYDDYKDIIETWNGKNQQLNLLMDGLMVRERRRFNFEGSGCCEDYITRPATVEEVREALEEKFRRDYRLKSGATLFMKEKE